MEGLPAFFGTLPQWGAFACLGMLLAAVLRYLPARMRAVNERRRDEATEVGETTEAWRAIEARVSVELEECRKGRQLDAARLQRLDDENFRMRIVLSMTLDEVERLDPGSDIILKARAIMAVAAGGDQSEIEKARLAKLLARIDKPKPQRRRRQRAPKT